MHSSIAFLYLASVARLFLSSRAFSTSLRRLIHEPSQHRQIICNFKNTYPDFFMGFVGSSGSTPPLRRHPVICGAPTKEGNPTNASFQFAQQKPHTSRLIHKIIAIDKL